MQFFRTPTAGEATPLMDEKKASTLIQSRFRGRQSRQEEGKQLLFARLGINNRDTWVVLMVILLFYTKGSMPFINDVLRSTQTALMDDPSLNLTRSTLGQVTSARDLVQGFSKLLVAPVLYVIGLRNVFILVLALGIFNMMLVPTLTSLSALYISIVGQALIYAWVFPATTMTVAGWVDGHLLGKSLGMIAVATKVTPVIISPVYAALVGTDWRLCWYVSAGVAGVALVLVLLFFRSSAKSIGFAEPTPPGAKPQDGDASKPAARSKLTHPLAKETTLTTLWLFATMRRTWALILGFSMICLLRQGSQFASIYARGRLDVTSSEASNLYTTQNIAAACAGLLGGFVYDRVPGGKIGIGVLMTVLNTLHLGGFIFVFVLEVTDTVSLPLLHVFMGVIGFAGVLPVSLPFQVYAMAVGGVKHCAAIVGFIEFVTHFFESGVDLVSGDLLEEDNYTLWLGLHVIFGVVGTLSMALFYYLDWKRAPLATSLIAAPDLNTKDKKSIARSMLFAAKQAESSADIEAFNRERSKERIVSALSSKA